MRRDVWNKIQIGLAACAFMGTSVHFVGWATAHDQPLDGDTAYLFVQAFQPMSWADRIHEWSYTPHPFGLLAQQLYLRRTSSPGAPTVLGSWTFAIATASVLTLAVLLFATWRFVQPRFRLPATIAVCAFLALSPVYHKLIVTLEEEQIGGMLLALGLLSALAMCARPSRPRVLLATGFALLATLWAFQYFAVMVLVLVAVGGLALLHHRRDIATACAVVAGSCVTVMVGIHVVGITRYVAYQNAFESIVSWKGSALAWVHHYVESLARWLYGLTPGTLATVAGSLTLVVALVGIALAVRSERPSIWLAAGSAAAALLFPFVYEPVSTERWMPLVIALPVAAIVLGGDQALRASRISSGVKPVDLAR